MITHEEIEQFRQRLIKINKSIINRPTGGSNIPSLNKLIEDLGAAGVGVARTSKLENEAILIANIHIALQTASMIAMCDTASKNYRIAEKAMWIALVSAAAAWAAVIVGLIIGIITN